MINDKTTYLRLPLPHQDNSLAEDLPRLRESLIKLDENAAATAKNMDTNAEAQAAALRDEVDARKAAVLGVAGELAKESADRKASVLGVAGELAKESADRKASVLELAARLENSLEDEREWRKMEQQQRAVGDEENAAALIAHDADAVAHEALVRRITAGDVSPIIGVCQVATGNTTGVWYNVDAEGRPISPPRRFFDNHPAFDLRRYLVDDQVMVKVDPFWFKYTKPETGPFAGKPCRIISPGPADGFRPYPAFLDTSGNINPAYIGAFAATDEGSSKAGSRPGKSPLVSLDFPTMRTRCANRNVGGVTGFRMWDIYHYSALCHLFLTEHCTSESQGLYGRGHVDSSSATTVDADNQPSWRGFTGLWGNVWQMVDGFRLDTSRRIEIIKNDGSQVYAATGKTAPAYDGTNVAYVITCQDGDGDGWSMGDGYFPLTSSTSRAAGSFGDYFYGGYGSAGNVLYVGGDWYHGSGAGLFCATLDIPASNSSVSIGCRLAK